MSGTTNKFSTEVHALAERMVLYHEGNTPLARLRRYRFRLRLAVRRIRCWTGSSGTRCCCRISSELHKAHFEVYGVQMVWRQLGREGFSVARCTVARLMRANGIEGAVRGKPLRTTFSDKGAPCPKDHVNREFQAAAPNRLWVSGFTCVSTWTGFFHVAFIIDAFSRRIVGWRVSRTAHTGFVLNALKQALHDRRPLHRGGLVHHSDRGSQYVVIKDTEKHLEAEIERSVDSVGNCYDCECGIEA